MRYISTRDKTVSIPATEAILKGISTEGGLFVPEEIPRLDIGLSDMADMSYQDLAFEVMKKFFDDIPEKDLKDCINSAYDDKFDTDEIAPVVKLSDRYILELFHGATIAFKDMALSILPHLMKTSARLNQIQDKIVILTATSGDTGKAALAGFAGVDGTEIIVFYPKDGVSPIQKLQMLTQKGANTHVIGIEGNFDDAQTGVKRLFADKEMEAQMKEQGYMFSSANSINIGRLIPQVVYYFWAYSRLLKSGDIKEKEAVNFDVPTGNFGNILAAFYAKEMGLPVNKLICASNENKVLFDFFKTGHYDKNRKFVLTSSPSMDILISSNLERFVFALSGNDSDKTKELMTKLSEGGEYSISDDELKEAGKIMYGGFASEEECREEIARVFEAEGYMLDPHTAVASKVYNKYMEDTSDATKTVIDATASPYKFTKTVMCAIDEDKYKETDDLKLARDMEEVSEVRIPEAVRGLYNAEIMHKDICRPEEMKETVLRVIGIK